MYHYIRGQQIGPGIFTFVTNHVTRLSVMKNVHVKLPNYQKWVNITYTVLKNIDFVSEAYNYKKRISHVIA